MSSIFRGRDLQLGTRAVAIKTLRGSPSQANAGARLIQEALLLASLSHRSIVTLYDHGEVPETGEPFLVMELLEGKTLREIVAERPLPLGQAASVLLQVTKGVAAVHKLATRHRDLSPSNVMVLSGNVVKIIDLGIAKVSEKAGEPLDLTKADEILGTPGYIAPEYIRGEDVDHRADLFAIGGMLYFATSGKAPFLGANRREILFATANNDPEPLSNLVPGVTIGFAKVVDLCLAKDPRRRPADADALAGLLLPFCLARDFMAAESETADQRSTVTLSLGNVGSAKATETREQKVTASDWIQMEDLFRRISGDAVAIWRRYEDSASDEWSVTPDPDRGGPRVVQRFLNEARTAGNLLARMLGSATAVGGDSADTWLSAVRTVIHPMNDLQLSGHDPRGESRGGEVKLPVQASITACAHFASALRLGIEPLQPAALFPGHAEGVPRVDARLAPKPRSPLTLAFDPQDRNCVRGSGERLAVRVERSEGPRAKDVAVILHSVVIDGFERPQPSGNRFSILDTRTAEYVADVSPGVPRYFSLLHHHESAQYRERSEAAWQLNTESANQVMHGKTLEIGLQIQSDYETEGVRLLFQVTPGPRFLLTFVRALPLTSSPL